MNVLSLSASFGALVWIFQDGHLSGLLGFTSTGVIEATQPILMLAIAFGLSMDYEVFLLSRIREQWDRTGDNTRRGRDRAAAHRRDHHQRRAAADRGHRRVRDVGHRVHQDDRRRHDHRDPGRRDDRPGAAGAGHHAAARPVELVGAGAAGPVLGPARHPRVDGDLRASPSAAAARRRVDPAGPQSDAPIRPLTSEARGYLRGPLRPTREADGRSVSVGTLGGACATSCSSARPGRSAPRRSTSCGATRTGSGSSASAPAAATSSCWRAGARAGRRGGRGRAGHRRAGPAARVLRRGQRRGYATGDFRVPKILAGPDAVTELAAAGPATSCSTAWSARSGWRPTLAALRAGRTLALANKESLVAGGPLVKAAVQRPGQIVPVDSEHSALAQCLRGGRPDEVRRLVLTASGGPFRGRRRDELADVTAERGAGPPDLGHGPGRHDQLGDAGQQGPRGDRGARAVRRPATTTSR